LGKVKGARKKNKKNGSGVATRKKKNYRRWPAGNVKFSEESTGGKEEL